MVTAGGNYYACLADLDFTQAQRQVEKHLWLPIRVALAAAGRMPAGQLSGVLGRDRCGVPPPDWWCHRRFPHQLGEARVRPAGGAVPLGNWIPVL
jgi:hypothetical protein